MSPKSSVRASKAFDGHTLNWVRASKGFDGHTLKLGTGPRFMVIPKLGTGFKVMVIP